METALIIIALFTHAPADIQRVDGGLLVEAQPMPRFENGIEVHYRGSLADDGVTVYRCASPVHRPANCERVQ